MEEKRSLKRREDLSDVIAQFLIKARSEEEFFSIMELRIRKGRESYKNHNKKLPFGDYVELLVTRPGNKERIVVDKLTYLVYVTDDHYENITLVGRPNWAR